MRMHLQPAPSDAHRPARGSRIPEMEGNVYLEDPAIGHVNASNLTSGKGGVATNTMT